MAEINYEEAEVARTLVQRITEKDIPNVEKLFKNWDETMIWSCLQGVMGEIYVAEEKTKSEEYKSAVAVLGAFAFFVGEPDRELVLYKPESYSGEFVIMVSQNPEWETLIEKCYPECNKKVERYALKKEPDTFDKEKLQKMVEALSDGYELKELDESVFEETKRTEWCCDWTAQYPNWETYRKLGLGVVLLKDGQLVSGASSYTAYENGIEIQVDTKEEYRRKGLAEVCSAKLILMCLERGLYPSWDAQNKGSLALAEKLGYRYSHTYTAYEVYKYGKGACI